MSTAKSQILEKMSLSELARRLGRDVSRVSRWFNGGRVPAEQVLSIETITGVSRYDIRPDLYPDDAA